MGQVIVLVQKICETCVHDPEKDGVNCPVDDGDFYLCGGWALSMQVVDYMRTGIDIFTPGKG